MRLILICALIIGLVLIPCAGMADQPAAVENETAIADASEEKTETSATIGSLAPMFGKVHMTLLMASEEAFGYLLSNDTAEK